MVTDNVAQSQGHLRIAIVLASVGRPDELGQWKERLALQTRPVDAVVYSVVSQADLPPEDKLVPGSKVLFGPKGSPAQRNTGLEHVLRDHDVICFFDDDYVPSRRMVEGVGWLFETHPDIISANGKLLADGINGPGIPYAEALDMLDRWDASPRGEVEMSAHGGGLYGCNMVYRASAIANERYDETLPLYGWQEDLDFGARLMGRGRTVITDAFAGVHQGVKRGRTTGTKLGYSQIANPVYLVRKGTMGWSYAVRLMLRNVARNHLLALRPEPWVDRAGRARGNRAAIVDLLRGRDHPQRALEM